MRKLLGVLVAVLAMAGGGLGSRAVENSRAEGVRRAVERAASEAAQQSASKLTSMAKDLARKVTSAATNPRLIFALEGNVDEQTMLDLWRTEEWWRPLRTEFKVYAVALNDVRLFAVEGIVGSKFDVQPLLRRVRGQGAASAGIIVGNGWPYAVAAAPVRVPGREPPPILVLAKAVDQSMLQRLVEQGGTAVTLSDGRKPLIAAGPTAERALLISAVGSESKGHVVHLLDPTSAAASSVVAPGVWLWTIASAGAAARDAQELAGKRRFAIWFMASLVAGVALVLGFVRRRTPVSAAISTTNPSRREVGSGSHMNAPGSFVPATTEGRPPPPREYLSRLDASGATAVATVAPSATAGPSDGSFGRYKLIDRLGEGGMAEVYTAVTFGVKGFRRRFVIKRLRAELARDPVAVGQFIDEAKLGSSMVHSNIVPVFDFGKVGEEYFLAQEYILGRDLVRVTRRSLEQDHRPLPVSVILYAAYETLKALEYAHTKTGEAGRPLGIVHRDVSPTNVIVSARGEVKLCDFGIVKADDRVTKTRTGVVKGNVTFMSPEQAKATAVDARADLFSLALLIYYCLTGEPLYSANTIYELLVKAAAGPDLEDLSRLRALPYPCVPLLDRALRVNPNERFQSAREFGNALLPHVGDGAAELAALMNHLFDSDFKDEETRFRILGPSDEPALGTGGPETPRRRS